jgi:hypothetical protein
MPSFGGGAGTGTRLPASTDDCKDVGGSIVGCGTGTRAGTAKSRAADWPGKPSLTPVVLALSLIASVEGGTAREPVPFPRDTASASLLRAVRDFCWIFNLSMGAPEFANRARASRAIQDNKHASWLRRLRCNRNGPANIQDWLSPGWQAGYWGLGIRHAAAGQTPQTPFSALHTAHRGEMAGILLADHELTRCASSRCKRSGGFDMKTPGPTLCPSVKHLKHAAVNGHLRAVILVAITSLESGRPPAG